MSVLIVVSHPDDEVLGCGATAAILASQGTSVRSCILSSEAGARHGRPELEDLHNDTRKAQEILGLDEPFFGSFSNLSLNTVPHIELVQFIEAAIVETGATTIFTHHPSDLNDDHRHTSRACQAAARLYQRRGDITPLKALYFMEILSATDWAFAGSEAFNADTYFEVGEEMLDRKIEALSSYRGVMREFPHPRSVEIIKGLAAYRGGQSGMRYAESFQTAFNALSR